MILLQQTEYDRTLHLLLKLSCCYLFVFVFVFCFFCFVLFFFFFGNRILTHVLEAANEPTRFVKDENNVHIWLEDVSPII